ncbi:MAG: DUF1540 domain-containing protein [Eubacteriales bacterium]
MEEKKPNHSIACTVTQCANHACECNYCVLDRIMVGTHEKNPTVPQCVDCESFVLDAAGSREKSCGSSSKG